MLSAQPGTTHFLLGHYWTSEDPCPKGNSLGIHGRRERKKREQWPSSRSRSCDHFSRARPYITTLLYRRRTAAAQPSIQCPALDGRRQQEQTFRSLLPHLLRPTALSALAQGDSQQRRWWWLAVKGQSVNTNDNKRNWPKACLIKACQIPLPLEGLPRHKA